MKLLVVGNGIAGSAVAIKAREQGHDVTVMADERKPAAAKAALCVVRPAWWSGTMRADAVNAIAWYETLGALTHNAARYTRFDKPDFQEFRDGYFGVDPSKVLVEPDETGTYTERPDGYDHVILCMGAYGPSNGPRAWGVTTVIRPHALTFMGQRAHFARPREVLFAVSHDANTIRFGSSVAKDEVKAWEKQKRLEVRALDAGLIPEGKMSHESGVRLMPDTEHPAGHIEKNDDHFAMHTFGRVGYSIAPARADELLAML